MLRRLFVCMAVCLPLLAGCGRNASHVREDVGSYQRIRLAMMVNGMPTATDTLVAKKIAELVERESNGNVKITVFSND